MNVTLRRALTFVIILLILPIYGCQPAAELPAQPKPTPKPRSINSNEQSQSEYITFPDKNLEAAIRNALFIEGIRSKDKVLSDKPLDEPITKSDLAKLTIMEAAGIPQEPALKAETDFDSYAMPDPDETWRFDRLREAVKRFKGEKAIFCGVTDTFDVVKECFLGDTKMFIDMIRNPGYVKRVSEAVLQYQLKYIKNCIEVGADFFFINGDYATTHAPMVSPKMAGEFLMPYLKSIADYVHQNGALLAKHSDGMLWSLFDQIVETGVNAIHPIDPEAGMDMGEAKARYGDKVCLMGNVDCGPLLTWGTPGEVRQITKECIRKGGKGGGLICMSSNSIHSGVKPENYLAMVETIHKYGTYPLEDNFDNLVEAGSESRSQ